MLGEKSMYAYEIKGALKERFGITPATVTVYVILHKMQMENLIRVGKAVSFLGRPHRIYYEITEKGTKTLNQGRKFLEETIQKVS